MEKSSPIRTDYLYTVGEHSIECEVFGSNGYLITAETGGRLADLGPTDILVPIKVDDLSREVIVGRKTLNSLVIKLDGKSLEVL